MAQRSGVIAILGRPNAGKSSLLNLLLKTELSIVTPKAQTTRERVLGIYTEEKGQILFVDTPGVHRARDGGINAYMVNEAREALDHPNLVWYLVDPRSKPQHEEAVLQLMQGVSSPVLILMNKTDLFRDQQAQFEEALLTAAREKKINVLGVRHISAKIGEGVDSLLEESWAQIPEAPLLYPDEDQLSDRPTRFFVAEKIREQLLLRLGEEVPYSCAVQIEKFDESVKVPRIEALIHVERESQKGIVIGKGGLKLKEIGQEARKGIEAFLGTHIYLGLRVKVLPDWTRDSEALRRMGYNVSGASRR